MFGPSTFAAKQISSTSKIGTGAGCGSILVIGNVEQYERAMYCSVMPSLRKSYIFRTSMIQA